MLRPTYVVYVVCVLLLCVVISMVAPCLYANVCCMGWMLCVLRLYDVVAYCMWLLHDAVGVAAVIRCWWCSVLGVCVYGADAHVLGVVIVIEWWCCKYCDCCYMVACVIVCCCCLWWGCCDCALL